MIHVLVVLCVVQTQLFNASASHRAISSPVTSLFHVRSLHIGNSCVKAGEIGPSNTNCDFLPLHSCKNIDLCRGFPAVLVPIRRSTRKNYSHTRGFPQENLRVCCSIFLMQFPPLKTAAMKVHTRPSWTQYQIIRRVHNSKC